MHTCPMVTGLVPHVGGPILPPCMINVLTCLMPQARITDMAICVGPPDFIVMGSLGVLVGGLPAARLGDNTAHGGIIITGCFNVLIGDTGSGSAQSSSGSAGTGRTGTPFTIAAQAAAFINTLTEGKYFPRPADQAQALQSAARSGAAFCERCAALAAAAAAASHSE